MTYEEYRHALMREMEKRKQQIGQYSGVMANNPPYPPLSQNVETKV